MPSAPLRVCLAVGADLDTDQYPILRDMLTQVPIDTYDGFPVLQHNLSWAEGENFYVCNSVLHTCTHAVLLKQRQSGVGMRVVLAACTGTLYFMVHVALAHCTSWSTWCAGGSCLWLTFALCTGASWPASWPAGNGCPGSPRLGTRRPQPRRRTPRGLPVRLSSVYLPQL